MPVKAFLQSGVGAGIWAQKAATARPEATYGWVWLGESLHVLLVFTIAYSVLRLAGLRHRLATVSAVPVSWIWAFLGPELADRPFRPGLGVVGVVTWLTALLLPLAALAPEQHVPRRLEVVRLMIWATPTVLVWAYYSAYDTRLIAGAWMPLLLLMGSTATMIVTGARRLGPVAAAVPVTALAVLAFNNLYNLDGLGHAGWRQYQSGGFAGLTESRLMENVALGSFQQELDLVRTEVGPSERIVGNDGRLSFFFPGRADYAYPTSCEALRGYRAFVLLGSDESVAQARAVGSPTTTGYWSGCRSPKTRLVGEVPSLFAVYVTGRPRSTAQASSCSVPPLPTGLVAVFGTVRTPRAAEALRQRLSKLGFVLAKVVRLDCERYAVLESGVPNQSVGKSIQAEGRDAGLRISITTLSP